MSSLYRIAAVLIGLVLCSSVQAQEIPPPPFENQPAPNVRLEQDRGTGAQGSRSKQTDALQLLPAIEGIESAIRDLKPKEDKERKGRQEQREISGLNAQQEMAVSAKRVFWTSAATVGLTLIGVVLIWRTLRHTRTAAIAARDAVDEAWRATEAAEKTLAVTQKTRQHELRAYVVVSKAEPVRAENHVIGVYGVLKNTGQTPAYNMKMIINTGPEDVEPPIPSFTGDAHGVLGAGIQARTAAIELAHLRAEPRKLIQVAYAYEDIFGQTYIGTAIFRPEFDGREVSFAHVRASEEPQGDNR